MSGKRSKQERRDAKMAARKAFNREWRLQGQCAGVSEEVDQKIGVLLPGVDPMVGEIALTALYSNLNAHPASVATALARTAPDDDIAVELVSAVMELMLCRNTGHLTWIEEKTQAILTGIRRVPGKTGFISFGPKEWPVRALAVGPPQAMTIRITEGLKVIWAACESLRGVVVRQSEAVALGNSFIERFGGRIVEDRSGPDIMHKSFIEKRMTQRATLKAQASATLQRRLIERKESAPNMDHCRVPIAEAIPMSLDTGTRLVPEGVEAPVYIVESRINESWVLACAENKGKSEMVDGGLIWVREDGKHPVREMPNPDLPNHAGFSDDPSTNPVDLARQRSDEAAEGVSGLDNEE